MQKKYDLIIIGAGIIGLTMAYFLSDEFEKIAVIEQNQIASGASGGNLGQLALLDRNSKKLLDLSLRAIEIYKEISQKPGFNLELNLEGGMVLLDRKDLVEKAKTLITKQNRHGLQARLLSEKEAERIQPSLNFKMVEGVTWCPEEGTINPLNTCLGFFSAAKEKGVEFYQDTKVLGFKKEGSLIKRVITDRGDFQAEIFIVATAAWTGELMKEINYDLPVYFNKGTALVTQQVNRVIRGAVTFGEFLTGEFTGQDVNVEPGLVQTCNGNLLLAQITTREEDYNFSVDFTYVPLLMEKICRYFTGLKDLNIIRSWAAITPYTEDGLPVFGMLPGLRNLVMAVAFKGAFSIAPAVAELTLKIIRGQSSFFNYREFSPARYCK